jgi:uncharacterized protein
MRHTILVVPGMHDSGADHWQTWLQHELPNTRRVEGIDWEVPVLANWAEAVRDAIDDSVGPVWTVAHSFGCLAAAVAAADRLEKVAGAMFVAPADPRSFSPLGRLSDTRVDSAGSLDDLIPKSPLAFPSVVVASSDDPWVRLTTVAYWANSWGSTLINIGAAGHVNVDSGFGTWPQGKAILAALMDAQPAGPLGPLDPTTVCRRGRHSALAKLRHGTRLSCSF